MSDTEIGLLQERVAQLQLELDELSARETRAQRAAVRARDELAAADRDAVRAAEALSAANEAAQDARDDLAQARDDLVTARWRSDLATAALEQADEDIAAAERVMLLRIRATYMEGGQLRLSNLLLGVDDVNMVLRVSHMIGAAIDQDLAVVDALAVARSIRQERLAAASAAESAAESIEDEVATAQQRADLARDEADAAATAADETAQRLEREADRLAAASQEVSRPRQELETQLRAARAALETTLSGGGVDLVTVWADRGDGVLIGGITVASVIAPQLQALLVAAAADGVVLSGSGHRAPQATLRLRVANGCPDLYTSPASACRVPTAIPGTSMHERGLAIDFSHQGRTLCFPSGPRGCAGNPGFDWLMANAARFGLQGSSVEAWHWSIDGR